MRERESARAREREREKERELCVAFHFDNGSKNIRPLTLSEKDEKLKWLIKMNQQSIAHARMLPVILFDCLVPNPITL